MYFIRKFIVLNNLINGLKNNVVFNENSMISYKNDKKNGKCIIFNTEPHEDGIFLDDMFLGDVIREIINISIIEYYLNEKKHGVETKYENNYIIRKIQWKEGKRHGKEINYDYKVCRRYRMTEDMSRRLYYDEYHAILTSIIPYKYDKKHGKEKQFYQNNNISYEIPWKNGKQHGKLIHYFHNKQVSYIATWKNGVQLSFMEFNCSADMCNDLFYNSD